MSPTIVLKDGRPYLALGTPGGTRIYAAVLQGINTHIANEGFLLRTETEKVLVDALFDGISNYPRASAEQQDWLKQARGPYLGVDLILATHFHDDHFSPEPVLSHLSSNLQAVFLSSHQVLDRLKAPDSMQEQWTSLSCPPGI